MCSLVDHDRLQENEQDDKISLGDRVIPKDATVKALLSLGATFNFIDIWLHNFRQNYFERSVYYTAAMVEMFKKNTSKCWYSNDFKRKKSKINYRYWGWIVLG